MYSGISTYISSPTIFTRLYFKEDVDNLYAKGYVFVSFKDGIYERWVTTEVTEAQKNFLKSFKFGAMTLSATQEHVLEGYV